MDKTKSFLIGLSVFILLYIGFTIKPLISYYSSESYVMINGKKYSESNISNNPSYKKLKKDFSNGLSQVF